jgi:hypothetical protein
VQVTVVVPTGNVEPDAGLQDTGTVPSTMSVALAENETAAPPAPVACTPLMFGGTLTTGGVVSTTVTTKDVDTVPTVGSGSVASQFTVVGPSGNVEPEGGVQVTGPTSIRGSEAVTEKLKGVPEADVASGVALTGTPENVTGPSARTDCAPTSATTTAPTIARAAASVRRIGTGWRRLC